MCMYRESAHERPGRVSSSVLSTNAEAAVARVAKVCPCFSISVFQQRGNVVFLAYQNLAPLSLHLLLGQLTLGPCQSSGSHGPLRKSVPQNQPFGKGPISHLSPQTLCFEGHTRHLQPGTSPSSNTPYTLSPSPVQTWFLPNVSCLPGLLLTIAAKPSHQTLALT